MLIKQQRQLLNSTRILIGMASIFPLAIYSVNVPDSVSYIQETPQDIQEAIINLKDRVPSQTTLRTLAGLQQDAATTTTGARNNQQIYNDIHELEAVMLELQEQVLNVGIRPQSITQLRITLNEFISMLHKAGIRYNLPSNFQITINQLNEWMGEVAAAPRTANFEIFKATLEVRLAEIVNLLLTKLVS